VKIGKVLIWFGPGVDNQPKAKHKNFMERIAYIARQPWFFGLIDNADLLLHDLPTKPVYMIRLSNDPGYFTIHTKKMKTRIIYDAKTGYKPEKGNNTFPDLVEFSETHLKAYEPLSGSDFIKIFGDSTFEERGLYDRMNNLISTEESEELIRISSQNSTKKIN